MLGQPADGAASAGPAVRVLETAAARESEEAAAGGDCLDAEHDTVLVRASHCCSSRPRRPLRLVLTGCALRVCARPLVLGGGCVQGLKRALCSTGSMNLEGLVALCRSVAAAYARRHGADCEPALEALAGNRRPALQRGAAFTEVIA